MSRENVELVREGYAAIDRRDMHAFLELFHPDVEATSWVMQAEGTVYRGREGMRRFMEEIFSVFPDWRGEVQTAHDFGDVVVAAVRVSGRAVESGISLEQTGWQAIEFRDGKVVSLSGYATEAEALEAVGRG
jgi:ketosteroid isomerase-like protein